MNKLLSVIFLLVITNSIQAVARSSENSAFFKTAKDLMHDYPNITDNSIRAEKKEILCPFQRMLERAGVYDTKKPQNNSQIIISIVRIANKSREFGCKIFGCKTVAHVVSAGQLSYIRETLSGGAKLGKVNLSRLHMARGIAHQCGLTFAKGGIEVSDAARASTLSRLEQISASNSPVGLLSLEDLMTVKREICKAQNVSMSKPGEFEVGLIYKYLGGEDRGFIEYTDVERFLHAKMPLTKSINGI